MAPRWPRLLAVLLAVPSTVHAHRPLDSTDAALVAPGRLELEAAPVGFGVEGGEPMVAVPVLAATAGLGTFELGLAGNHELVWSDGDAEGVLTGSAVVKALVRPGSLQGRPGPSVALQLAVNPPPVGGSEPLGAAGTVVLSHQLPAVWVHVNADLVHDGGAGLAGGVALVGAPDGDLHPLVELRLASVDARSSLLLGLVRDLGDNSALDLGAKLGTSADGALFEARAGLTWTVL